MAKEIYQAGAKMDFKGDLITADVFIDPETDQLTANIEGDVYVVEEVPGDSSTFNVVSQLHSQESTTNSQESGPVGDTTTPDTNSNVDSLHTTDEHVEESVKGDPAAGGAIGEKIR